MHWGDMGAWGWGGFLLWVVFLFLLCGVLAAVLVAAWQRPGQPPADPDQGARTAERILAERFARGEIDEEDYLRWRQVIRM